MDGKADTSPFLFYLASFSFLPDFVRLAVAENTMNGRFVKKLPLVAKAANSLVDAIQDILVRGEKECEFIPNVDPLQLYLSVLSLSYLHLSNRHTLSVTYGQDMTETAWLDARRAHVTDMIISYCGPRSVEIDVSK